MLLLPAKMVKFKDTVAAHAGENMDKRDHSSIAGTNANLYTNFGNRYDSFSKNWESV